MDRADVASMWLGVYFRVGTASLQLDGTWGNQLVQLPHLQVRKPETQRPQYSDFSGGPVVMIPCFHCRGEDSIPGQGTEIPMPSSTAKKKKNCNTNLHGTEPGHKCKSSIGEMPITWFLAGPLSSFCTHSWAYIHSFLHTHTLLAHWDRALYTRSLYVVHHLLSAFSALFCESVLCAVLSSSVAWLFASPWL